MAALSAERNTKSKPGELMQFYVAAGVKIYKGALVVLDGGCAKPGMTGTGLKAVGMARETVDNTYGQAADKTVVVQPGIFQWDNSSGDDEISASEVGEVCYVVDDHTVAKTDGDSTRSPAGVVVAVDQDGVWVLTRL
jgi:hypothetical protein